MTPEEIIQKLRTIVTEYEFSEKPNSKENPSEYFYLSGLETVCDDIKEIIKDYERQKE